MTVNELDEAPPDVVHPPVSAPAVPATPVMAVHPGVAEAATYAALMAKSRRHGEFKVPDPASGKVLLVEADAIGFVEYDELVAACPPKGKDAALGGQYDLEKFGPRLLAACLTVPVLTVDETVALWKNPNWAGGEIVDLFRKVNDLCQRGLDVPFIAPG